MATLTIPLEKLAFVVLKAQEVDAEVEPVDPEDSSNQPDDAERQVLEDRDDSALEELYGALAGLNEDELAEVAALRLVGRGDFDAAEWEDALAAVRNSEDQRLPRRLVGDPLLGSFIEAALDQLGYSLEDLEGDHL
ncbi:MAG: DUF3775 domain-containing protein [Stellaceae bacterium]